MEYQKSVQIRDARKFIKEHRVFLINFTLTYLFTALFIWAVLAAEPQMYSSVSEYSELVFGSVIPTTFTYSIINAIFYLGDIYEKSKTKKECPVNQFLFISLVVYAMVHLIDIMSPFSFFWLAWEALSTLAIVYLSISAYREMYFIVNRQHSVS